VLVKELNNHANGLLNGHTVRSAKHANGPAHNQKTMDDARAATVTKSIALVKIAFGYLAAER
jgi:hypothetical protein